jgi:hypothetical protein
VIITVGAKLIGLLELLGVLTEALLAFLAGKNHFDVLEKGVRFSLGVALGAVEPFLAAGGADCYLGVENVLTKSFRLVGVGDGGN